MSEAVEIAVIIIRITDKAVQVTDTVNECWLPLSLVLDWDADEYAEGVECELTIPEWLAIEKGLA